MNTPINKVTDEDMSSFSDVPTLNEYQGLATRFAVYPGQGTTLGLWYTITKLNGEAGEAAEHIGKAFRDDGLLHAYSAEEHDVNGEGVLFSFSAVSPERYQLLIKELGDVLWYVAAAAKELDTTLAEVARTNLAKLKDRSERDALQGSGDNR